jgi:hypothetical protein
LKLEQEFKNTLANHTFTKNLDDELKAIGVSTFDSVRYERSIEQQVIPNKKYYPFKS